jgi:hypothetical protein
MLQGELVVGDGERVFVYRVWMGEWVTRTGRVSI